MRGGSESRSGGPSGASGSIDAQLDRARSFAQGWIAQNIEVDAFSWDDPPIYDAPLESFRAAAARLGLDEEQLEAAIGAVPQFIAEAYARAAKSWRDRAGPEMQPAASATPKPAPSEKLGMTKIPRAGSSTPHRSADKQAPDRAVDRPGFDLSGSTGETTAGLGLGLGDDASDTKLGRSLPGRRFKGTLGIPQWRDPGPG